MEIEAQLATPITDLVAGFGFAAIDGTRLLSFDSDLRQERVNAPAGLVKIRCAVPELLLQPGIYGIDVGLRSGNSIAVDYLASCVQVEIVAGPQTPPYLNEGATCVRMGGVWTVQTETETTEIDSIVSARLSR